VFGFEIVLEFAGITVGAVVLLLGALSSCETKWRVLRRE
jgi:hypothetical protein